MATDSIDFKKAAAVYDFTVKDNDGNEVGLEKYRGQVLLIVNIASKCGLTKTNYKEMTELQQKYADKGKTIVFDLLNSDFGPCMCLNVQRNINF
jgi:glutathione peroxidase-family protein